MKRSEMTRVATAVALALGATGSALAAEAQLEEVQVTGSRILQAPGMQTPTPVTSLTIDELEAVSPGKPDRRTFASCRSSSTTPRRSAGPRWPELRRLQREPARRRHQSHAGAAGWPSRGFEQPLRHGGREHPAGNAVAERRYHHRRRLGQLWHRCRGRRRQLQAQQQLRRPQGAGAIGRPRHRGDGNNYEVGFAFGHKFGERFNFLASLPACRTGSRSSPSSRCSPGPGSTSLRASRIRNPAGPILPASCLCGADQLFHQWPDSSTTLRRCSIACSSTDWAPRCHRCRSMAWARAMRAASARRCRSRTMASARTMKVAVGYKRDNAIRAPELRSSTTTSSCSRRASGPRYGRRPASREHRAAVDLAGPHLFQQRVPVAGPAAADLQLARRRARTSTDNTTGDTASRCATRALASFLPNNDDNPLGDTRQTTAQLGCAASRLGSSGI